MLPPAVHKTFRLTLLIAFLLSDMAFANQPNHVSASDILGGPILQSAIAARLENLWGDTLASTERWRWRQTLGRLRHSDPLIDAEKDTMLGIGGIISLYNTTWNLRHIPGLTCNNDQKMITYIIYTLNYSDYFSPSMKEALIVFRRYARDYNIRKLTTGNLLGSSCLINPKR